MLWPLLPSACTVLGNSSALATDTTFGLYPFCCDWFQNVVKSGGITTPVTISASAPRKAAICALKSSVRFWKRPGSVSLYPCLAQDGRKADHLVAPGIAVAIVGKQRADRFVGRDLAPHAGENADDVFQAPEVMECVVERLPALGIAGIGLARDEIGLPGRHRRDAGNLLQLALGRHRIVGLRRRTDENEPDVVAGDQFLGDFGGTIRIGLAVLGRSPRPGSLRSRA